MSQDTDGMCDAKFTYEVEEYLRKCVQEDKENI